LEQQRVRHGLLGALAGAALALSPAPSLAAPVPADCVAPAQPAARQTLDRVGRGPVRFPLRRRAESIAVPIRLSDGAGQGRDGRWFVARLHFRVVVSPRSGDGFADVSALVNGRSAMLVELETRRRAGRPPALRWSTAGLIDGRADRAGVAGRAHDINHINYVQEGSVHGGANRLTFRVERYGALRLASLEVAGDSGVLPTALAPPHLSLHVASHAPSDSLAVGRRVTIGYRLRNDGGCPARDVEVGVVRSPGAVEVAGPPVRRLETLTGDVRGAVTLRPLARGRQRVLIGVNSSANSPGTVVELPIREQSRPRMSGRGAIAAAVAALALLATGLWWRARRRPATPA
jgi:hypothetical protein